MEVWIVEAWESPSDVGIEGVFATEKLAKGYMARHGSILNEGDDTVYRAGNRDLIVSPYVVSCYEVKTREGEG